MEKTAGEKITDKLIELHGSTAFSVAFLPYKRSMWNSMASVYDSCKAYGIDAHVYPLPYYLMDNKGLVDRIASDKDLFQDAEDIKKLRHADYVVIHYPYDSRNSVTQMLPEYYIQNLRNIGEVVYIPYSQTHMPQLWMARGLANINYAFLPSERAVTYFLENWKQRGVDFTGRVFSLGSPKLDIHSTHPPESDTVLVATSLFAFLLDPFARMDVWEQNIMAELAEGKRVTFRPHPLLYQTIKAMRPDTRTTYDKLLKRLETQGVKIDLSEDLETALTTNKYLITDPSSIIDTWKALGKDYEIM